MKEEFRIDELRIEGFSGLEGAANRGRKPTKEEIFRDLLKICLDKQISGFMQIDAYPLGGGEEVDDEVQIAVFTNIVYGLMHEPEIPVSIQIAQGSKKGEVIRYLLEVVRMLEEDWHHLGERDGAGIRPKFHEFEG